MTRFFPLPSAVYRLPAFVLLAAACATGYHTRGVFGDGYWEQKLAPDVWQVSFDASAFTPRERLETYLLWRCSEIAIENHADYFGVLADYKGKRTSTEPSLLDRLPYSTDTSPSNSPPESGRSRKVTIQLYKERPDNVERFFEARAVMKKLAAQMRKK